MRKFDPSVHDAITNNDIAEMLKFYNLYNTTKSGHQNKLSGTELLNLIAHRLRTTPAVQISDHVTRQLQDDVTHDRTYLTVMGERLRPVGDVIEISLNHIQENIKPDSNFLKDLTAEIKLLCRTTPGAANRSPNELASEVTLWVKGHKAFADGPASRSLTLNLQLHNGVICNKRRVVGSCKDWFITCEDKEQLQTTLNLID